MAEVTLVDAVCLAMNKAMSLDPTVLIMGEDVGMDGGVFRATNGLIQTYGDQRVFDTPLAEGQIVGHAIGLAVGGFKPIAEIQFMGFIYPAMDQIVNHMARLRNRTRGRLTVPMVLRTPHGAGIHAPEHHSESTEALFAHLPGIRVVIPSSPSRAYGLLMAAIQSPDPVIFLEPTRIYRAVKEEVIDDGKALPLDTPFLLREGSDLTIVSWGAMIVDSLKAAQTLSTLGIEADVLDLATLSPLNMDPILASVEKTGRCVIVHEATLSGGIGAEIAARLASEGLTSLLAPVQRVTSPDTILPLARLEHSFIPDTDKIVEAAQKVMSFQ